MNRRHAITLLPGCASWAARAQTHETAGDLLRRRNEPQPAPAADPEQIWADLARGNRRFIAGQPRPRRLVETRRELVKGQHPRAIVLTCADSRVSPELLFDQSLGDLFVVRTAGNVADAVALGSIEYAAEHLHAPLLIVLGHESCGAVAAALSSEKVESPNLQSIVDRIHPAAVHARELALDGEAGRLTETLNVHQSATDLLKNSAVLRAAAAGHSLTILKAVYRLDTGEVVRL
jgi:carbonic anhydrase